MIPRLEASEQLCTAMSVAIGANTLDRHEGQRLIGSLQRQIEGPVERAGPPSPAALAAMGIKVVHG